MPMNVDIIPIPTGISTSSPLLMASTIGFTRSEVIVKEFATVASTVITEGPIIKPPFKRTLSTGDKE